MMGSSETDLPFVGAKVSLTLDGGEQVDVVIHLDGTRDIAIVRAGSAEPHHVMRLDPAAACALGALLCAAFQPRQRD